MARVLAALLLWAHAWLARGGKGEKPCMEKCRCSNGPGRGDCGFSMECRGWVAFPEATAYPEGADCLFLHSSKLGKLDSAAKERGLRALPASLRRLDLSECALGELPESASLGHLTNLRVLNLEFNRLRTIPRGFFSGLGLLKVLWLTGNHLQPDEPEYGRMKKLGNRLDALDEKQFDGLHNLQVLLLHHNRLKSLPDGVFECLRRLRVLKLLDNPFKPRLKREHPAFRSLLAEGDNSVLRQLDLRDDSGDSLEDFWEETQTYLSDDFVAGPLPSPRMEDREEL